MNIESLFTDNITVKISVVKIDNKKFTKSMFNQINVSSPFDKLYNLKNDVKFLGYINDKGKWIIWTNSEFIFKYDLREIYPIARVNLNRDKISELIQIYPSETVKSLYHYLNDYGDYEYRDIEISSVLDIKEQYVILDRKEEVKKIINEILNRQIFT